MWLWEFIEILKIKESEEKTTIKSFKRRLYEVFFEEAVDLVYLFLGLFTYIYLFAAFIIYFGSYEVNSIFVKTFETLAEPYLGGVAIYVVLKESRKRLRRLGSRHRGENFVLLWAFLITLSIFAASVFEQYTYNGVLSTIIKDGLAVILIYAGSIIHKP